MDSPIAAFVDGNEMLLITKDGDSGTVISCGAPLCGSLGSRSAICEPPIWFLSVEQHWAGHPASFPPAVTVTPSYPGKGSCVFRLADDPLGESAPASQVANRLASFVDVAPKKGVRSLFKLSL